MPLPQPTDSSQRFHRQLEETRTRIETLPDEWRSYFRTLADQAEEHHRSMEQNCLKVRELVDDMRLNEASAKFDLWAAAQDLRTLLVQGRIPGMEEMRHGEA